jgi:HDOD domain
MKVSELRPGLVLAQAVRDVNGRLLMGEGTFLNVLKAWGIAEVHVQGEKACSLADAGDGLPEALAARAQDIAAARLSRNDLSLPFVRDVFHLAVERMGRMLEQGEPLSVPVLKTPCDSEPELPPLDLERLVTTDLPLGAMPEVLARLAQIMENPSASAAEAADIIQCDPGLCAKLLKMVNSPLYGFPQHIDTITRAVTVIGVQQLSALALGVTVMGFSGIFPRPFWTRRSSGGTAWPAPAARAHWPRHLGCPTRSAISSAACCTTWASCFSSFTCRSGCARC